MDDIGATRALVFGVLTEMLKQDQLISCFQGYTELIILKVLESHRDAEKDVSYLKSSYVMHFTILNLCNCRFNGVFKVKIKKVGPPKVKVCTFIDLKFTLGGTSC